jgi:DNA-binding transcriptional LysR family regulator
MASRSQASLKQLETLSWVSKLGSFQAAALRLNTTQSAVSKRVADLEALFGKPLFDRSRRTARLTPDGKRLVARADELLALSRNLFSEVEETAQYDQVFRLAASELIGMTWLSRFMQAVSAQFPRLLVEIEIDHGGRLLDKLNQEQFDLALIPGPMWGNLHEAVPLKELERAWMASPLLEVPRRVLTIEELSSYPMVVPHPDSLHARFQSGWLRRNGFLVQRHLQANSFPVLGEMVLAGLGIAQLPVLFYADAVKAGQLVKIRTSPEFPNVHYFAVYRRSFAHPLAPQIAKLAKKYCDFSARAVASRPAATHRKFSAVPSKNIAVFRDSPAAESRP